MIYELSVLRNLSNLETTGPTLLDWNVESLYTASLIVQDSTGQNCNHLPAAVQTARYGLLQIQRHIRRGVAFLLIARLLKGRRNHGQLVFREPRFWRAVIGLARTISKC